MFFRLKMNVLMKILILLVLSRNVKCDCSIKYINDVERAPKFERVMGRFKINIPFRENDGFHVIKVQEGETVQAYCRTYFNAITYKIKEEVYDDYGWPRSISYRTVEKTFLNQTKLAFTCRSGTLSCQNYQLVEQTFSCMEPVSGMYSAKTPYAWCENNQNSSTFLLAVSKLAENNVLAALCYNIHQMLLQTLVYNTTNLQQSDFEKPIDANSTKPFSDLDEKLANFKTSIVSDLSESILRKKLSEMSARDDWLDLANYEVSLIAQDQLLNKFFKDYGNVLNIVWWRNLRVGNWKRFQNSLTNYAHNNSYELYVGTSGVVQYPTDDKCEKERYLEINLGFHNETVPAYIWTYLRSIDNLNQDFVMVGFNSPYAEYFTTDKIIFCPDICSEIPWLKEISATFRYAYAGIMFCCSTDFIRQSNYLQGFPTELLPPEQITTTSESVRALDNSPTKIVKDLPNINWVLDAENEY